MFVISPVALPLALLTVQVSFAGCVATVTSYGEFGCSVTLKVKGPSRESVRLSLPLFCRTMVPERPAMLPPMEYVAGGAGVVVVALL
jgi:hypothetical protein